MDVRFEYPGMLKRHMGAFPSLPRAQVRSRRLSSFRAPYCRTPPKRKLCTIAAEGDTFISGLKPLADGVSRLRPTLGAYTETKGVD